MTKPTLKLISPGANRNVLCVKYRTQMSNLVKYVSERDVPTLMRYPDVFYLVFDYLPTSSWHTLRQVCKKFYRLVTRHSHQTLVLNKTPRLQDVGSFLSFNPRFNVTVHGSVLSQQLVTTLADAGVLHINITDRIDCACLDMRGCTFSYLGSTTWPNYRHQVFTPHTVIGFDSANDRVRLDLTPFYQAKHSAPLDPAPYNACRALLKCLLAAGVRNFLLETTSWCCFATYPLCLDFEHATVTLNSSFAHLVLTNVQFISLRPQDEPWENPARVLCTNDWYDHIDYSDGFKYCMPSLTALIRTTPHRSWDFQPLVGVPEALIYLPDDG